MLIGELIILAKMCVPRGLNFESLLNLVGGGVLFI